MNGSQKVTPEEIAGTLRERIRSGALKAGDRLSTQAELADEFRVERGAVRKALQILQDEKLLSNVSKGSPPRVAGPPDEPQRPRATVVSLNSHLEEAFSSPRVEIDAVCFTAETLMLGLNHMRGVIAEGKALPESIRVRCLLPGPDIRLAFPVPVPKPEERTAADERDLTVAVQRKLRDQIQFQRTVMERTFYALREVHHIDATVTFGWLSTTPMTKWYVLNGKQVLLGDYVPAPYPPSDAPGGYEVEVFDVRGFDSPLFEFRLDRGGQDAALVEEKQKGFNALWATIAAWPTLA